MWLRAKRREQLPNWRERAGDYDIERKRDRKRIWLHAVSVGEVRAAEPILSELRALLPDHEVVITVTTSTGYGVAQKLVGKLAHAVYYFPLDVPRFCVNAMFRVEPAVVAVMETELWMNFLTAAKSIGARTCLLNARVSDRSYRRARWLRFFYRAVLARVDECLAQSELDAERLRSLGARTVRVVGNCKFDEALREGGSGTLRSLMNLRDGEPLVVVGSVRGEEEERLVIEALAGIEARILFAPRHIERANEVVEMAKERGFDVGRRSLGEVEKPFVVLDTLGELSGAYVGADVAIIGGGFSRLGGQNLIQPMAAGVPVVCGPHMFNFRSAFDEALREGAVVVAGDATALRSAVDSLLADAALRAKMGDAGRRVVERNRGSARRYAEEVARLAHEFHEDRAARREQERG